MTAPRPPAAMAFDAEAIHSTIQRALSSAGLDTASGPMRQATETIRQALAAAGLPGSGGARPVVQPVTRPGPAATAAPAAPQRPAGQLAYRLHVPAVAAPGPRPLLVMLHGCTQSADDFAAGTRMNQLADAHGVLVAWPEQSAQANASRCWNWFQPQDQARGAGEPALLAAIVRDVAASHAVDPQRIYVAGLSAGAAMAVVLGQTYPDLFAAVGVHSGLPYGSAHDMASALAKMKGGRSGLPGLRGQAGHGAPLARAVPTIVFHGDRDHLVQHSNGSEVVGQCLAAFQAQPAGALPRSRVEAGVATGGRRYTRTVHADAQGRALVEDWTVHGAGHAWSGGDAQGSYTDAAGPDASAEMLRFFLGLHAAPSH